MSNLKHAMWAERHRPQTLDDCILEILPPSERSWLRSFSDPDRLLPNILFYGSPGTGKTTMARVLTSDAKYSVIAYNGSLVVKDDVSQMERCVFSIPLYGSQKVILIDEVDGLTVPAQLALRALMEKPSVKTAWVMTCNFRQKIIDPLLSRVVQIDVSYPPRAEQPRHIAGIIKRCQCILHAEGVTNISDSRVQSIVERHYPDVRQIINNLQKELELVSVD